MILSDEQIQQQMDTIVRFLSLVHPTLSDKSDGTACVEIRPIGRGTYNYRLSKPFCLWKFDETSLFLLKTFLENHNGNGYCLYYSVFNFDYEKKAFTKAGKVAQKGRITVDTARYVNEIAIDFDDIQEEEVVGYMKTLEDIGVYPLWTKSGHGYHAHILLNENLWNKTVLFRLVYLLRSRGFMADTHCIDAARVFRLPGTYNYKGYKEDEEKDFPLCEIVKESDIRYNVNDIVNKISELPIISEADYEIYSKVEVENIQEITNEDTTREEEEKEKEKEKSSESNEDFCFQSLINYPELVQSCLPDAVIKMLNRTPEGYRNSACGFLMKYFKDYYKLSREDIYSVLLRWSKEACDPPFNIDNDFDRLYNSGGLNYDTALSQKFGYIDFTVVKDKSTVWIPNAFFKSFSTLSGQAARMYLAIKKLEHYKKTTSLENIMKVLDVSHTPTARNTVKELIENNFVYTVKGAKKNGVPNTYFTQKIINISEGQTRFSYNDIAAYVGDLNGNELKLYTFMKYKCARTGECFMAQRNIGKATGLKQSSVCGIIKTVAEKEYIAVNKMEINEYISYCNYTLMR